MAKDKKEGMATWRATQKIQMKLSVPGFSFAQQWWLQPPGDWNQHTEDVSLSPFIPTLSFHFQINKWINNSFLKMKASSKTMFSRAIIHNTAKYVYRRAIK